MSETSSTSLPARVDVPLPIDYPEFELPFREMAVTGSVSATVALAVTTGVLEVLFEPVQLPDKPRIGQTERSFVHLTQNADAECWSQLQSAVQRAKKELARIPEAQKSVPADDQIGPAVRTDISKCLAHFEPQVRLFKDVYVQKRRYPSDPPKRLGEEGLQRYQELANAGNRILSGLLDLHDYLEAYSRYQSRMQWAQSREEDIEAFKDFMRFLIALISFFLFPSVVSSKKRIEHELGFFSARRENMKRLGYEEVYMPEDHCPRYDYAPYYYWRLAQ